MMHLCGMLYTYWTPHASPYMPSLVIPCAALESRQGLRLASRGYFFLVTIASRGDFVVKIAKLQYGNRMFEVAGPAH